MSTTLTTRAIAAVVFLQTIPQILFTVIVVGVFVYSVNQVRSEGGPKGALIEAGKSLKDIYHAVQEHDPEGKDNE